MKFRVRCCMTLHAPYWFYLSRRRKVGRWGTEEGRARRFPKTYVDQVLQQLNRHWHAELDDGSGWAWARRVS